MKKPKQSQSKQQVRAFRKAARDLGTDESEANFDAALKKVARHKPKDDPMPTDDSEALIAWGKKHIQE